MYSPIRTLSTVTLTRDNIIYSPTRSILHGLTPSGFQISYSMHFSTSFVLQIQSILISLKASDCPMKLLIKQFAPAFNYFFFIWSKFSPQHPLLEQVQSISFPQGERSKFCIHIERRSRSSFTCYKEIQPQTLIFFQVPCNAANFLPS
jgi:hypothetical protein